ncbi:MAG: 2'-5' RNA ligase family protein, partial [Planctomycetota bacterium]
EYPAYIVLDLPAEMAARVQALRDAADPRFPPLPVEITVAGSSGVGPLAREESQERVFSALEAIAGRAGAIRSGFAEVLRFPGSPVFYLRPVDLEPFVALHRSIISADLRFQASPFPYSPHCTIRSPGAGEISDKDAERVLGLAVPPESFVLDTLSVYELDGQRRECRLLHRCRLTGASGAEADEAG